MGRKSFKQYDAFSVAMACVLLSCKLEEKPKLLRDIIFAFNTIYYRRKNRDIVPMDTVSEVYSGWKDQLISLERIVLKELGFCFHAIQTHPHNYILCFVEYFE